MMDDDDARVTVSVRVRPKLASAVNTLQQSERYEEVVCVPTSDTTLRLAERRAAKVSRDMHFAYDHVFDLDATQAEVYETAALDAVDGVLSGTNASLLTYGQTGSGKTYTVLGKGAQPTEDQVRDATATDVVGEDSGLLLRAIQDMLSFGAAMRHKKERHVVLGITAIEIYNDELRDLLREGFTAAALQPIMTRDALHFPGLTHMPLHTLRDACAVYERAAARRVQRATSANDTSSRSHAIFTVEVFQSPMTPSSLTPPTLAECCAMRDGQAMASGWPAARPSARCGNRCFEGAPSVLLDAHGVPFMYSALTVADLAGSEKAKHADVHGTGFDELRRINASLTALGNVVHHLYHCSAHIPYRDSKLTMVLRDTFAAPQSRVVLFVNVSPTAITCEETLSSLYFADKMKGMKVSDVAASPRQAALQSSYLASLRVHDALLADMHIFHAQHELSTGLLQRAASIASTDATGEADHTLFQLPFRIALGEGPEKAAGLRQLCTQLKAELRHSESPEARTHRLAEAMRREMRKELLKQYSQRRAEVHARIAEAERAGEHIKAETAEARAVMRHSFALAKAAAHELMAARQELSRAVTTQAALVDELKDQEGAAPSCLNQRHSCDGACEHTQSEGTESAVNTTPASAAPDEAAEDAFRKAEELAQLHSTFLELVAFRVRTDPPPSPSTPLRDRSGSEATSRAEKSRSRSGTASSFTKHATVEEWVRGAVLAMAGNAVVQSARRRTKQQDRPSRLPLGDVTNTLSASLPKARQLPKYWRLLQEEGEDAPPRRATDSALGVNGESVRSAMVGKRTFRSSFDDPALFTRVTAYMDMGASLVKIDHTGHPRPRWFYLAQREDRYLLCWDESRRRSSLGGGGHVYLDAVEKIILGRSSPGFLKYAKLNAAGTTEAAKSAVAGKDGGTSFTVVYHSHSNRRDVKFVDVVCPDKSEMETWVVGLAHWAGVLPHFVDSRQPEDDVSEEQLEWTSAAETAGGLDAREKALCRLWHIPAKVMTQTRDEMRVRRLRHRSGRMRLTPGELRDLTGLDIFRASALWRYFEQKGWVVNPTKQLCCFVDAMEAAGDATGTAAAAL